VTDSNNPKTWLNEHGDYLYRYAMSRLHDHETASDMLQETLLAGCRGYANFAGQSSIRTWLVGILKHKIIDLIRKEIRTRNLTEAIESDPTSVYFDTDGFPHARYHRRGYTDHLCSLRYHFDPYACAIAPGAHGTAVVFAVSLV